MISDLQLQKGNPIDIGLCKIYPLTLGEITDLGENLYNQYLSVLLIDKSSLNFDDASPEQKEVLNKLTPYEIINLHISLEESMKDIFTNSLSLFLREKVEYHYSGFFYLGKLKDNRKITDDDFNKIKEIIKKQNYLKDEEDDFKPANDKTIELFEKMKKIKDKLKKQNSDKGLKLSDIVSIVASYSNDINIFTVWNLKIYQLYESYLRLIMWDNYHTTHMHLPHMDEEGKDSLVHWASELKQIK